MTEKPEEEEWETAMGAIYTHVDCPHCGYDMHLEGDWEGDTVECFDCGEKMIVRRT